MGGMGIDDYFAAKSSDEGSSLPSSVARDQPTDDCRYCGGQIIPIVYGYPGPESFEAAERAEVEFGGYVLPEDPPTRRCRDCGAAFRDGPLQND